jgi:hypothetical protein
MDTEEASKQLKDQSHQAWLDAVAESDFHFVSPAAISYAGDLYPSHKNSEIRSSEALTSVGKYIVSTNNFNIGGTSEFNFSSSSLLSSFVLNVEVHIPGNCCCIEGWLWKAIRTFQISFTPSIIQNTYITGQSLFDYSMLSAQTADVRSKLLRNGGYFTAGASGVGTDVKASIPLSFMLLSNSIFQNHPIDLSTMSQMRLSITWNPTSYWLQDDADGTGLWTAPNQFNNVYISCATSDIMDSAFKMKTILNKDPNAVYAYPVKYLRSNVITIPNYTPGQAYNTSLQDFQGLTTDVIYSVLPDSLTQNTKYYKEIGSVPLRALSLTYAGEQLANWNSDHEYKASCVQRWGDELDYEYKFSMSGNTNILTTDVGYGNPLKFDNGYLARTEPKTVYATSFASDPRKCLSFSKFENVSKFDGRAMSLSLTTEEITRVDIVRPFPTTAVALGCWDIQQRAAMDLPAGEQYNLNITYVQQGVLQIDRDNVRLITQ